MDREPPTPADHQPIKAELEEDVRIDATPEALGWVVTRCGAEMREETRQKRIKGHREKIAELHEGIALDKSISYSQTLKPGETTESGIAKINQEIALYEWFIERLRVKDD